VVPLCRDPEIIKPLLLADEPGTRSLFNLLSGRAGGRAVWVRVDNPDNPQAVVCRSGALHRRQMLYLYAANARAAAQVLDEIPGRWRLEFAATSTSLVPAVRRVLRKRGRRLNWVSPCFLYVLDSGPSSLVIDRSHRVARLKPGDARLIVNFWPHGRNADYIRWRIMTGPTCAIRRRGRLVAWALTHADGAMGILHVLDEFRGQGMARSITTALAERCRKAGLQPFLYIVKRNNASIRLTESMGFKRHAIVAWFGE
jgi:8-oxo-dGTP diphosphatase